MSPDCVCGHSAGDHITVGAESAPGCVHCGCISYSVPVPRPGEKCVAYYCAKDLPTIQRLVGERDEARAERDSLALRLIEATTAGETLMAEAAAMRNALEQCAIQAGPIDLTQADSPWECHRCHARDMYPDDIDHYASCPETIRQAALSGTAGRDLTERLARYEAVLRDMVAMDCVCQDCFCCRARDALDGR